MKQVQYIDPKFLEPKDAWGKLSLAEKSAMIEAGVANGLTKLSDIRESYNSFAMGGDENNPKLGNTNLPYVPAIIANALNKPALVVEQPVPPIQQDTVPTVPAPINRDEVKQRQAFMETEFNDKAVSRTGAMGRWQIMPNTLEEYTKKTGITGDLTDTEFNGQVRDWYLDGLLGRNWVTKGEAPDSIQWGKALAAYNYGPTNVVNTLNKAKKEGVDIYNGWDWLGYMPQETQDYVNFVLRNKDINKYKNQERYDKAVKKLNKKELGGPLMQEVSKFEDGGKKNCFKPGGKIPMGPVIPALLIKAKDKYLADYANRGNVMGYPSSVIGLLQNYVVSPYNGVAYDSSTPQRRSLFAKYFNVTDGLDFNPDDYIVESEYRPSVSKDGNAKYYTFKADSKKDVYDMFRNEAGRFKIDYGKDENGRYISIYDDWDLAPFGFEGVDHGTWQSNKNSFESFGAKPVELYDRIYESKDPDLFANFYYNANIEKNGGKIHIKPLHRGKVTYDSLLRTFENGGPLIQVANKR